MNRILDCFTSMNPADREPECIIRTIIDYDELQLKRDLEGMDKRTHNNMCVTVADSVRAYGAGRTLNSGAMLYLFWCATPELSRKEQIAVMEDETGIGRTQQYRCIEAFERFGRDLLPDPTLAARFVSEALKRLAAKDVPEAASAEALARARVGEIINLAVANDLIRKHRSTTGEPSNTRKRRQQDDPQEIERRIAEAKSSKELHHVRVMWKYADNEVQVLLAPARDQVELGAEAMIYALERALEQVRRESPAAAIAIPPLQTA